MKGKENIEQYMNTLVNEGKLAGAQVAITNGKEVIYRNSFGYRDLERQEMMTEDTTLSIQSITKSFLGHFFLKQHQSGKLRIDDPVIHFLPYFRTKDQDDSDQITIRHLLNHSAGFSSETSVANILADNIEDYQSFPWFYNGITQQGERDKVKRIKSREELTRYFENTKLSTAPGENWSYFTDGYVILADVIEKETGETWEKYTENHIFRDFRMNHSYINKVHLRPEQKIASYYTSFGGHSLQRVPYPLNSIAAPIGLISCTANDLISYMHATVFKDWRELEKFVFLIDDQIGYSLGWFHYTQNNINFIEHTGGYLGVNSLATYLPQIGKGFVVLTNNDQAPLDEISRMIVEHLVS
jgi:CubicO group peptidase (beta-lactamase class C family)